MPEIQSNANSEKSFSVLITGGSGLIGKHLTSALLAEGFKVSHLSRSASQHGEVRVFFWNPEKRMIDPDALEDVDFIIHLAGANIGAKRWTRSRKKEILSSRTDSSRFLHELVNKRGIRLKGFISASASGIYGSETSHKIFSENDPPAVDFLGNVCKLWEEAADLFDKSGIRTVKIRSSVVLEKHDSALTKLMKPGKFGFLISTGTGHQYMPWIHINDLCNIYIKAIRDSGMSGAYNAVAPHFVTHNEFMHVLSGIMRLPVLPFAVPGFILRIVFGEMSDVVLKGSRISSEKIANAGFVFKHPDLEEALENIIRE